MSTRVCTLLKVWLSAVAGTGASLAQQRPASPAPLAIVDVTVIDMTGRPAQPHMTVMLSGDRITKVARASAFHAAPGTRIIDGAGLYLIPALWDMHTHSGGYANALIAYPRLVEHGILGVRDMGTPLEEIIRIRDALRDGRLIGPRLVFAGPLLQGPLPFENPVFWRVDLPSAASRIVDSLRQRGVDYIKVSDAMPRVTWMNVMAAAKAARLPVAGHVPPSVSVWEASAMGQASIEHLGGRFLGVLLGCSTAEDQLRQVIVRTIDDMTAAIRANRDPDETPIFRAAFTRLLLETLSQERTSRLIRAFRVNHNWQVFTLGALPLRDVISDTVHYRAEDRIAAAELLRRSLQIVGEMERAGVGIMAGTDLSLKPEELVDELALLVQAGLTPMQALQSATANPARFLHLSDSLGTVQAGKVADLVLLEGDPLADVRNVSRVRWVIRAGVVAPRGR